MKKYSKELLLSLVNNEKELNKEISLSMGFVLKNMQDEGISIDAGSLMNPSMSAWALPYIIQNIDTLSEEQKEILKVLRKGTNYWVKNKLVKPDVEPEHMTDKLSIKNNRVHLAIDDFGNNYLLYRNAVNVSNMLDIQPIENEKQLVSIMKILDDVNIVLSQLSELYGEGSNLLADRILEAIKKGGFELTSEFILKQKNSWVNALSRNRDDRLDILLKKTEMEIAEILKKWEAASSLDIPVNKRSTIFSNIRNVYDYHNNTSFESLLLGLSADDKLAYRPRIKKVLGSLFNGENCIQNHLKSLNETIIKLDFASDYQLFNDAIDGNPLIIEDVQFLMKKHNIKSLNMGSLVKILRADKEKSKEVELFLLENVDDKTLKAKDLFLVVSDVDDAIKVLDFFSKLYFLREEQGKNNEEFKTIIIDSINNLNFLIKRDFNFEETNESNVYKKQLESRLEKLNFYSPEIQKNQEKADNDSVYHSFSELQGYTHNSNVSFTTEYLMGKMELLKSLSYKEAIKELNKIVELHSGRSDGAIDLFEEIANFDFQDNDDCIRITCKLLRKNGFNSVLKKDVFTKNIYENKKLSELEKLNAIWLVMENGYNFTGIFDESIISTLKISVREMLTVRNIDEVLPSVFKQSNWQFSVDDVLVIADNFENIRKLKNSLHQIFNDYFNKDIADLTKLDISTKEMHDILLDKFLTTTDSLKVNPLAYVLFFRSHMDFIQNLWKYSDTELEYKDYGHTLIVKHLDVDIFNQGMKSLEKALSIHKETEEYQLLMHRMYHLTWERCKTSDPNYDNKIQSWFSEEDKVKLLQFAAENTPQNLLDKNIVAISDNSIDYLEINNWGEIFLKLCDSRCCANNYTAVEKNGMDKLLEHFLNYSTKDDLNALNFLTYIIENKKVGSFVQNEEWDPEDFDGENNDAKYLKDYFKVLNFADNILPKVVYLNELRMVEIKTLYEHEYLDAMTPKANNKKVVNVKF